MKYAEIQGEIISMQAMFDYIAHGCNCFVKMKRGIAPMLAEAFPGTLEADEALEEAIGKINKLGCISVNNKNSTGVINCYTQYHWNTPGKYGIPLDYDALRMCMRKINMFYPGKKVAFPDMIGCGLAKGDRSIVRKIIQDELTDVNVFIVKYNGYHQNEQV